MGNTHIKPHSRNRNKKQVHWKAADLPSPPGKPHLATENDLMPDLVTIRWSKSARDGGSPITGYLVEHRRTGSPHWVRATPLLVPFTELTISGLEPGWRYQFRVSAENAVGVSDPSEISDPLTVALQKFAISAPKFVDNLKDVTVLENDKVEFSVHFIGQPYPKICWFKDGFEIFSSRRTRILTENDKSILTIHQSALSDEGEIKCTATNKAGHASTKAKLTLEAPPSIRLPRQYEDGLLFEIGEVIRLKVSVAGRPNPLIFWSHNGESIQNNDRYEIEYADKCSILKLNEAQRSDRGEYQIKAVNKIGQDTASFLVTVTDKPSPPGRARVIMTLGRSVTLSWNTPEDDGGCKIGNYIIEYYRLGWNMWLKAATSRYLTTILGDLIEGSEYKFRIKAESPYGVSEPSEESDIIFIPDPKRGITSPEIRSRSQPRDLIDSVSSPIAARRKRKPRSQSSTRAELFQEKSNFNANIYNAGIPKRPERNKLKSPPKTPEPSPLVRRKEGTITPTIIDRASIARELSYGSPDIKIKKTELFLPNQNLTPSSSDRSGSSSPAPFYDSLKQDKPSSPVSRSTAKSPSPLQETTIIPPKSRSPSPRRDSVVKPFESLENKRLLFKENLENISGSSEFMLVLYPDDKITDQERRNFEILFDFEENLIPPPLSLSAPELGSEPLIFENLKSSVSSTELLHERTMMRFNKAAEAEEAELEKSKKYNQDKGLNMDIPKIQINSKDDQDIVGLERKNSFRRRVSSGGIAQQQILWAQRRYSLRNTTDLSEIDEIKLEKESNDGFCKRNPMILRQRSESEEKEEEEFEKVRQKMASQGQSSSEKRSIDIVDEEKWMEDYEESLSEEETSSEEERYDYKEENSINMYSDDEEEVYHPGAVTKDYINEKPFEILTKRNKLPDPNFVPKPILKKPGQIEDKIEIFVEHNINSKKIRSASPIPSQSKERSQSLIESEITLPKLKANTIPATKRQRSFSLIPFKIKDKSEVNTNRKLSPEKSVSSEHNISKVAHISGITAASIVIPQRLLNKKQDDEETKVVIDHYGDIVRNYSIRNKSLSEHSEDSLKNAQYDDESTLEDFQHTSSLDKPPFKYVSPERPVESMVIDMVLTSKKSLRYSPTRELSPKLLQQRLQRSPSPRRRRSDKHIRRESLSKSPKGRNNTVRPENWSNTKFNFPYQRKSSPSPKKQIQHNSPLSTLLSRPRPMLKEIMTQTSIGLEATNKSNSASSSVQSQEIIAKTNIKVRNAVDYITDLAMFCVACWLYVFDNELLAIPVLLVMIYRQLQNEILKRIPKWFLKKIKTKPQKK